MKFEDVRNLDNRGLFPPGKPSAICTYSGVYIDVTDPKPQDINIEDIAQALSMQTRWGGHISRFYSVAQHSVHTAEYLGCSGWGPDVMLMALLHDASEAYLMDIPSPIKQHLKNYKEIEAGVMGAVAKKFGLPLRFYENDTVKMADHYMLVREWHELKLKNICNSPLPRWSPQSAKLEFIKAFKNLRYEMA